jgi:hypothetical protein
MTSGPTREEVDEERRRARRVRLVVDLTCALIVQGRLERREAEQLVTNARAQILELFPGREQTYEIVYARRFRRCLEAFTRPEGAAARGTLVAFPEKSSPR